VTEFEDPKAPGAEKRRSTRIIKSIPITVIGTDALGQPFRESTNTVMINCYGCKYQSAHYVPKNTNVTIDVHRTHRHLPPRSVRGRVIWVQRPRSYQDVYHIGLEFEVAGNAWSLVAPPADWFPFPGDEQETAEPDAPKSSAMNPAVNPTLSPTPNSKTGPALHSAPNSGKHSAVAEEVLLVPASVAVSDEFEVDCTVEMSASGAAAATHRAPNGAANGDRLRTRQNASMREMVREIVDDKLTEHSVTMRRHLDDSLQQLLEKVYARLQANAEESRAEIRAVREALTLVPTPMAKVRPSRRRKALMPGGGA
jgi:hypothetical protein